MKKQADKIRRIGLIGNREKADCAVIVRKAARLVERAGRKVFCDAQTARLAGLKGGVRPDIKSLAGDVDLLLIFGGDGTILRTAREIAGIHTPMLGVNIGGLGFLTEATTDEAQASIARVLPAFLFSILRVLPPLRSPRIRRVLVMASQR